MKQLSTYTINDIERFLEIDEEIAQREESASLRKLLNVQDKISIFKDIDPLDLKAIIYDLKFVKYNFKDYIVKQGDESKNIFFIIEGECQVFFNKRKVGVLKPGETFGESGVIFKTKRNASVVCSSEHTTLLSFCIDEENMEFCAEALAKMYKNLARQINAKLEDVNSVISSR